jgi:hypothetical protein
MSAMNFVSKGQFHLIFKVLPLVVAAAAIKIVIYALGWELIPKDMTSFFPSILTGIIFILGFILAGVLTDYKESEKIPNEIAISLYIIWQEAYIIGKNQPLENVKSIQDKLKQFFPMLKKDFFRGKNRKVFDLIDSFSDDFCELDKKNIPPPLMGRLRAEQANIRKMLNRMQVIIETDFVPSVFVSIKAITIMFLLMYCFLQTDQHTLWGGVILVSIFTFIIFSIIFLIADMDNPFEYGDEEDDHAKSDEISLTVLQNFHESIMNQSSPRP